MASFFNLDAFDPAGLAAPADLPSIVRTESELSLTLPQDYKEFLLASDGFEGWVGTQRNYIQLFKISELKSIQADYDVPKNVPGFLMIASDGGGEAYGFDTRTSPWSVCMLPFIVMNWTDAVPVGASFTSFIQNLSSIEIEKLISNGETIN